MERGFIGLYRKIKDWEWYTDTNVKVLFIHLLICANYTNKKWRGITVHRGEYITSIEHLATESGLTIQMVRTALNKLIKTNEVLKKATNKYTVLTIIKYGFYQDFNNMTNIGKTIKKHSANNLKTITKKGKEKNKVKKEVGAFTFLKNTRPNQLDKWLKKNKDLLGDFDKFVLDYNDTVQIEGLQFEPNRLFARLNKYARNWIKNQYKYNNESSTRLGPRKRIEHGDQK